jgi:UDP-sulfoquinovose synthase
MRILVIGGDGYLGWPTAMHFSKAGNEVMVMDNFVKRKIELEEGIEPLFRVYPLQHRIKLWKECTGKEIQLSVVDLLNARGLNKVLGDFQPEAIVHYGEQPSAPYSMQNRQTAVFTQHNNVIGNLNLLFAIQGRCPDAHLIKLGTMGEYGTPNIDIEEGYIKIEHNGRSDTVLYPKKPHSFYHLSKVHDSNNIFFVCNVWGLSATDLNQGVVYGIETEETVIDEKLMTSFHYDDIFGTVINRFCVQAAVGEPMTVYGKGGQTRGFLDIRDTIQCVDLAVRHKAKPGEYRVFNQFTEQYSVRELAEKVSSAAKQLGLKPTIATIENPRAEKEEHYYNAKHSKLQKLGLQPHLLSEGTITKIIERVLERKAEVVRELFQPRIKWKKTL